MRRVSPPTWLASLVGAALVLVACSGQGDAEPGPSEGTVAGREGRVSAPATEVAGARGVAVPHVDALAHAPGIDPAPREQVGATEPGPVAVEIPAIGAEAELVRLGLNEDGSMEVPDFGLAGWYGEGPRPGAAGPSVIVAHVDSTVGPDVFHGLARLSAGDDIHVHRDDGSTVTFEVEHLEQHPKDELPGDRIWARSEEPRLTLITCGGVFDRTTGHYEDNVIAYAGGGFESG